MKNPTNTKATTIRMPQALWDWLEALATSNRRSINSEVVLLIEAAQRKSATRNPKKAKVATKE